MGSEAITSLRGLTKEGDIFYSAMKEWGEGQILFLFFGDQEAPS